MLLAHDVRSCIFHSRLGLLVQYYPQQLDEFMSYGLPAQYFNVMTPNDVAKHVMSLQGACLSLLSLMLKSVLFSNPPVRCVLQPQRCLRESPVVLLTLNCSKKARRGMWGVLCERVRCGSLASWRTGSSTVPHMLSPACQMPVVLMFAL